jgi:hypothetical protein
MTVLQRFRLVGITEDGWKEFESWFTARKRPLPVWTNDGVFVARQPPPHQLLAGCLIYPTDGPYAVVEFAATNPRESAREVHDAMVFGAQALTVYGAMRRKIMLCFPVSKGMTAMLKRAGFQANKLPFMYPAMVA